MKSGQGWGVSHYQITCLTDMSPNHQIHSWNSTKVRIDIPLWNSLSFQSLGGLDCPV